MDGADDAGSYVPPTTTAAAAQPQQPRGAAPAPAPATGTTPDLLSSDLEQQQQQQQQQAGGDNAAATSFMTGSNPTSNNRPAPPPMMDATQRQDSVHVHWTLSSGSGDGSSHTANILQGMGMGTTMQGGGGDGGMMSNGGMGVVDNCYGLSSCAGNDSIGSYVDVDQPGSAPNQGGGGIAPGPIGKSRSFASAASTAAASALSHLTEVTDYSAMERNYRASSVCTEYVEERGLKDPIGFAIICSVVLLGGMSRGVTFPTLWLFVDSLGGSTVTMGYCIAAFSFGRVVTSPLLGHLSVRHGYRATLLFAGMFLFLGALLYAQARSVARAEFLILAQCILGVGSGTLAVTRAYVCEVTPKGLRTQYLAYLAAVRHAGFAITPLLSVPLISYFQDESNAIDLGGSGWIYVDLYTAPGYVLMIASLLMNIALMFFLKDSRRRQAPRLTKRVSSRIKANNEHLPEAVAVGQRRMECGGLFGEGWSVTVIDCVLWSLVVLNMISKGYTVTYETLGVKLAQETFAIDSKQVGYTMGCAGILGIILLLSLRFIRKILRDVQLIVGGLVVSMVGIASLTDFGGEGTMNLARFVVGFVCVYGVGFPVSDTAIVGLFSKVAGNKPQGTLQGVLAASSALSRMVVPLIASYVSQYTSMAAFFVAVNVVLVCAASLVFFNHRLLTILST